MPVRGKSVEDGRVVAEERGVLRRMSRAPDRPEERDVEHRRQVGVVECQFGAESCGESAGT
jgi:hypothetical protein